ncbi:MAG: 50S ribosomal protein L4 [Proteobacteria bacterium]|nr:50S ribosomal protein L4 [Pseudomonadota bacterium]
MKMEVITLEGKKAGSVDLPEQIFGAEVRKDLLHRMVLWQLAKSRTGTADTKDRSEVSRTGSKLYRQKGTGRARHGSARVNQFRGGGVVFGPTPRSFAFSLTKKVRRKALTCALSAKAAESKLVILDEAKTSTHKTKDLATKLKALGLDNALFIVDSMDENFTRASSNLPFVQVLPTEGANVYDILHAKTLVLTKNAVPMIEARLTSRSE